MIDQRNDGDKKLLITNFKIGDIVLISKYKIFSEKVTHQIDLKKFFRFKELKILCRGQMLFMILTRKKLLELFKKKNQDEFRVEKVIKEKGDE